MELNLTQRQRMKWVRELPEAAQRPKLATVIAMSTSCSPKDAKKILSAASVESGQQEVRNQLGSESDEVVASLRDLGVIADTPANDVDDGDDVVALARSIGLKGFSRSGD